MKIFKQHSFLYLLPLLFLYAFISYFVIDSELGGDQERYFMYAKNLVNGSYALDGPLFLWNGPGYPLILSVFIYLGQSILLLKSLNVLFLFFGILFFHKTCRNYFTTKQAIFFSYLLGLYYPNILFSLRYLLSEGFSFFLACALLYFISQFLKNYTKKTAFLASLCLAFLILTKVVFAYVVFALMATAVALLIFKQHRKDSYKLLLIFALANVMTLPYLFYTYNLTGNFPYYSNSGGQCIYWLSTPFEDEQGEWVLADNTTFKNRPQYENHKAFLSSIDTLKPVEKDKSLKTQAIENIKNNPKKFLKNYISNVSRLFLDIPNSYTYQGFSFILIAIPNSFIFVFIVLSMLLTLFFIKKIPLFILITAFFTIIYLFGSSLLCAYARMLFPILPFLFLWIFYVINLWKASGKNEMIRENN